MFRGPLVALNALRSLCQLFGCPPGLRPSPPVIFPTITCQGKKSSLVSSCHGHREEEPSLTDGRFDALGSCLLEGLRVRKGGVVGALSALEANDSQEDLVRRSEPSEVLRAEGPRHTHPYSSLNYLGLQHTDFQTEWSGRLIIQLRAEPFEACSHECDVTLFALM